MSFQFSRFSQFMVQNQLLVLIASCSKHYLGLFYHCRFAAIIELKEVKLPTNMMFSMAI